MALDFGCLKSKNRASFSVKSLAGLNDIEAEISDFDKFGIEAEISDSAENSTMKILEGLLFSKGS